MSDHVKTMIPMQVLSEIDSAKNPMQITRDQIERAAAENQFMNGKIAALTVKKAPSPKSMDFHISSRTVVPEALGGISLPEFPRFARPPEGSGSKDRGRTGFECTFDAMN
jgi:hypothetical protein